MIRRGVAALLLLVAMLPGIPAPAAPARPVRTAAEPVVTPVDVYRGWGAWIDVYDWSAAYTKGRPRVSPATIDTMAAEGVQTLYVQAAKAGFRTRLVDEHLLRPIVDRARARGIRVVGWYLPTLVDPADDMSRLRAIAALPVDGIGVDIEARSVRDLRTRNDRLVALSADLRRAYPKLPLAAVTLAPVHLEVINPSFWPAFPWRALRPYYDVWMPMGYWANRTTKSGYRDGYRYTDENVRRLRSNLGDPAAAVHPIGSPTSAADIAGMRRAVEETRSVGGSVYDWQITPASLRPSLKVFRDPDVTGRLEAVTGTLLVTVRGWATDPDTTGPVEVEITVDGASPTRVSANRPHPDAGAHGFETSLLLVPGSHVVCARAFNVGWGVVNPSLGCVTT